MKYSIAILAGLVATSTSALAQFDIQLPLQAGWQQTVGNPAILQDHRITVGLPSVGAGFFTPFSANDAGEVRDGTLFIDPDALINRLEDRGNDQRFQVDAQSLAFNYRRHGWQVGVSHNVKAVGAMDLPKGLVQLAANGNAPYAGEQLQVMPIMNAVAYQEFAVNGAATFWESFTVGARLKYIRGTGAVQTSSAEVRLATEEDYYASSLTTNVSVNTAGFPVVFNGTDVEFGDLGGLGAAGSGFGADLGFTYTEEDKFRVGLSIRDLGMVRWTGEAKNHRSVGEFDFRGYEGNVFEEGGFEFDFEALTDSILGAVQFASTDQEFTTALPTTVQGTFEYQLAEQTAVHGTLFTANAESWHSGFGVGVSQRAGKWLHVGALAGIKRGGGYVGANLLVDIYGAQFYVATDDLIALSNLNNANSAYVRAGINLSFCEIRRPKNVRGFYNTPVEGINK